ncbi:MAG: adenylosuccinate synthase [Acholeplasmatales bacterium]|jgi:adenylosuccinate synthase|nr:adenylosuccinate synthase [Acholeplasmatales bacterium]
MKRVVVFGCSWGDEGKGKISNLLSYQTDCVVRFQGGANAGHSVVVNNKRYAFHLLPSGIINPQCLNILANGMVIDPLILKSEIESLGDDAVFKLAISNRATIVLPIHQHLDIAKENLKGQKIGTTGKGIGPAYSDKIDRINLKVGQFCDLFNLKKYLLDKELELKSYNLSYDLDSLYTQIFPYARYMASFVTDTAQLINELIASGKKIIFEGAQGSMLDIEHGTYPFVTSSSPIASSVPINCGIAPWLIDGSLGIVKAYTTRVGNGPFPTEIQDELATIIRTKGHEFGVTTGRPRRIGWLDLAVIKYTKMISGISYISLMLLDVLSGIKQLNICTHYEIDHQPINYYPSTIEELEKVEPVYLQLAGWDEDLTKITKYQDLPINAQKYVQAIEQITGIKVLIISVGPDLKQTIVRGKLFD